jgi:hypothetical protein
MQADPRKAAGPGAADNVRAGNPVLLVIAGSVVSHSAISRAAELAGGTAVTVVGMGRNDVPRTDPGSSQPRLARPAAKPCPRRPSQSPGSDVGLESKSHWGDEDPEQVRRTVALALSALENAGVAAKVRIVTGPPALAVARVARSSGARVVILDQTGTAAGHSSGGGFVAELRRRMHGSGVAVLTEADRRGGWMSA